MKRTTRNRLNLLTHVLLLGTVFLFGIQSTFAARKTADYYTNAPLVNQDGKIMRFYDDVIKGKVVAINFMFTSCEDSCPLETAKLRFVKQLLGEHVGKNVHMYSITVDPKVDTPAVLKAYMAKFKIDSDWDFLTGKQEDIDLIRKKLGMYSSDEDGAELSAHAITFILGNETTGQWIKRTPFDLPETLASELLVRLQTRPLNLAALKGYADSRIVKAKEGTLKGMDLFNSRCSSCHTFGLGDGLGPDLLGVASKRDHAWLVRWIREPDVMLKQKDPLAVALFNKYDKVQMPNVRLTEEDAKALILYMQERTRQFMKAKNEKPEVVDHSQHHMH